ncbi:MAG: hypothetical protein WBD36_15845 [Bacteroidota bacterium]
MIDPGTFYNQNDLPDRKTKDLLWKSIHRGIGNRWFHALERRSFLLGMAASLVLMFAAVGTYMSVKDAVEYAQPNIVKLDRAYQAAIREFENLTATEGMHKVSAQATSSLESRKEQLRLLEQAIEELRQETKGNDLSELKRAKLRELYGKKLRILQEMVEQGEINL